MKILTLLIKCGILKVTGVIVNFLRFVNNYFIFFVIALFFANKIIQITEVNTLLDYSVITYLIFCLIGTILLTIGNIYMGKNTKFIHFYIKSNIIKKEDVEPLQIFAKFNRFNPPIPSYVTYSLLCFYSFYSFFDFSGIYITITLLTITILNIQTRRIIVTMAKLTEVISPSVFVLRDMKLLKIKLRGDIQHLIQQKEGCSDKELLQEIDSALIEVREIMKENDIGIERIEKANAKKVKEI